MVNQQVTVGAHYAKDGQGKYLHADPLFLEISELKLSDLIGETDLNMPWAKTGDSMMENDAKVIHEEKTAIYVERSTYKGKPNLFRSIKFPFKGLYGKVLGVYGISIPISDTASIALSIQQTACLKYLALGHTHRQIADILGLKEKTVNHYLDTVKMKLNCYTRAQLVQQAIERGLIGI